MVGTSWGMGHCMGTYDGCKNTQRRTVRVELVCSLSLGVANTFYYSDDAILIDPTLAYTYSAMYYNGLPLQVDQDTLKEFVKTQM